MPYATDQMAPCLFMLFDSLAMCYLGGEWRYGFVHFFIMNVFTAIATLL